MKVISSMKPVRSKRAAAQQQILAEFARLNMQKNSDRAASNPQVTLVTS